MLTVLTWLWSQPGGRVAYTPEHVNIWAAMVRRHLTLPHRLACVTDQADGIDPAIQIIPPPRDFESARIPTWPEARPQCLRRLAMFHPDAAETFGPRLVCMDLDCVIGASLDPLFDRPDEFVIFRGTGKGRPYNGSMMMLRAGSRPQVYTEFTLEAAAAAGMKRAGSDQAWIAEALGPNEATWGAEHGVEWFNGERRAHTEPLRVLFFPGGRKPWATAIAGKVPWIREHYRGERGGRCLLVGDPEGWPAVEAALDAGPYGAVIATPQVAGCWPGPVLAQAETLQQAERLARMHGFTETARCGWQAKGAA